MNWHAWYWWTWPAGVAISFAATYAIHRIVSMRRKEAGGWSETDPGRW